MKKHTFISKIVMYLLRGMLLVAPLFFTIYSLYFIFTLIDDPLQNIFFDLFGRKLFGLGLLTVIVLLIFIGYLSSTFLLNSIFLSLEEMIFKVPFVKELYKSFKDIVGAFVSDKKRFNTPVLVKVEDGINRLGYITNEDLNAFGIDDLIAVYFPMSYAITGELLIVEKRVITLIDTNNSKQIMKFIVSGGIVEHFN